MRNNVKYWTERALLKEKRSKAKGDKLYSNLKKEYKAAYKDIEEQLSHWYRKYADENIISINQARKKLSKKEWDKWQEDMEDFIKKAEGRNPKFEKELRKRYIKSRVSKLESLQNQVSLQLEALAQSQDIRVFQHLKNSYKDTYYQTLFDSYKTGVVVRFDTVDDRLVEMICNTPWSGKNFSERIWGHNKKLVKEARNILSQGVIQGIDINMMSRKLAKRMDVNLHRAKTLIRTETNFVLNQATADAYEKTNLDEYQFLATLDKRTSSICRGLDNKIFKVKDKKVGVNYPPVHPNCRSTTIPHFKEDKGLFEGKRFARDRDDKGIYISDKMGFKEWYDKYIQDKPSYKGIWKQKDGLIVPTKIVKERYSPTIKGQPNSIIQVESKSQVNRDFYDSNGWLVKQLHGGPHGNPKEHPFGEYGEHAHYWVYDKVDGKYKVIERKFSKIKDSDYRENRDLFKRGGSL